LILFKTLIRRPHTPQRATPPESCPNLSPALDGTRLPSIAALATSTSSRGMPESGTGTAIHSALGLMCDEYFRL
jgi:hypothetical protein